MILTTALLAAFGFQYALGNPLSTYPFAGARQQSTMPLAPVLTPESPHLINNSYIIMLKPGVDAQTMLMHFDLVSSTHAEHPLNGESSDAGLKHVYDGPKAKGYAGTFSDRTVERIRAQPEVDYVEQDQVVWAYDVESMELQRNAPWVRNTCSALSLFI